tara:strand:+ start:216 stop:542 length:327 start_codon:yes stop_codon:yes gene_type:complete
MKGMLKGQLLLFMGQAIDLNYIPQIFPVMTKAEDFVIAVHAEKSKTGFLGVMENEYGRDVTTAWIIHINKWQWAEIEGFTVDDIFSHPQLCDDVFEMVKPSHLACRLK